MHIVDEVSRNVCCYALRVTARNRYKNR